MVYSNIKHLYSNVDVLSGDFEIDKECESCNKIVTIECRDLGMLF